MVIVAGRDTLELIAATRGKVYLDARISSICAGGCSLHILMPIVHRFVTNGNVETLIMGRLR